MNKEEILAKARKENKGADIVDLEVQSKSRGIAGAAAMLLGAVINLLCDIICNRSSPIFWVMFFCYLAALGCSNFILGIKNGRRKNSIVWLLYGAGMGVMTVLAVIRLFTELKAGAV